MSRRESDSRRDSDLLFLEDGTDSEVTYIPDLKFSP